MTAQHSSPGKPDGYRTAGPATCDRIERLACVGENTTEVMHEMNNLLTVLLGHAAMLRIEERQPGDAGFLDALVWTCEACRSMARGILDFARGGTLEDEVR